MKIVIIGAAGFLGSALVEYLSQNHEVIGVDKNFSDKIKIYCKIHFLLINMLFARLTLL